MRGLNNYVYWENTLGEAKQNQEYSPTNEERNQKSQNPPSVTWVRPLAVQILDSDENANKINFCTPVPGVNEFALLKIHVKRKTLVKKEIWKGRLRVWSRQVPG